MPGATETTGFRARAPRSHRGLPLALAIGAAVAAAAAIAFVGGRASNHGPSGLRPAGAWRALPRAPIPGRIGEAVVWTGRELIVAGGVTRPGDGTSGQLPAAAAYDPAADAWRRLAPPPAGVGAGADWTGHTLVVWTGNGPAGAAVAASYDPSTDQWRRLPDGPLGPREGNANLWTGDELLVIGGHSGDAFATPVAAALDPATGRWRPLYGLYGLTLAGGPNGAVWDGREAIVAGALSLCPEQGTACGRSRPIVVAYDPAADRMREVQLPSASAAFGGEEARSLTPVAWTGREVIFRVWSPGSLRVLRYAPAGGAWHVGAQAPCVLEHGSDTQTAWIGDRLVAPCGVDGLQVYDPRTDSWQRRTLTPGISPFTERSGSALAWTGRELLVWSGWAFGRLAPTPSDGASLRLGG